MFFAVMDSVTNKKEWKKEIVIDVGTYGWRTTLLKGGRVQYITQSHLELLFNDSWLTRANITTRNHI